MRLKKLQLQGFKTFAERTEIEFSEGVTAIVGPNGSGKSNLGDAILWVLGEQKASAMRGAKAQDVIFAGSDKRKPTGMAEVSLTVDNSDGTLPVDFAEVTITRRAYRTGDGEYFLNKVPCRLKDIYELFLDTGVGREAYSLVNQSEIDAVLSVNPEDRRGLFEEAAGIKKYRVKKREALRKLENTEVNVHRVADILHEISGRLEPLRMQAERAARFTTLKDRLRAVESGLLIVDLRFVDAEWQNVRQAREEYQAQVGKHATTLAAAEARASGIATRLADAESRLEAFRLAQQQAFTQAERAESGLALAQQRAEGLASSGRLLAQELEEIAQRRSLLSRQAGELQADLDAANQTMQARQTDVTGHQTTLRELQERLAQVSREGERRRMEALTLARRQAGQQAELARAEARVAESESALPNLREELTRAEGTAAEMRMAVQSAQGAIDAASAKLLDANAQWDAARARRDAARQGVQTAQARAQAAQSESVAIATRLRTLQELEAAQEGYFAGVRAVFEAKKHGELAGEFTVVADSFATPPGYETALEIALSASLQDIITDTEEAAKAAIAYLHQNRLGRATFLPLNRMRPGRDTLDLGRAVNLSGVRGAVLEIVTFDAKFRPALDVLLGRVFVCETLDDALRASTVARGWNRVVTLTGELVLPTGALTGGRQAGRGGGSLLSRKTEIASLIESLASKEQAGERAKRELTRAEQERTEAETALSDAQSSQQTAQGIVAETKRAADHAEREAKRALEGHAQAQKRLETVQTSLSQSRLLASETAAALSAGGLQSHEADDATLVESEALRQLGTQRDDAQSELTSARIALATATEQVSSLERAGRGLRSDLSQLESQETRRLSQKQSAETEYEALLAQAAVREQERSEATAARAAAQFALENQGQLRQQLLSESYEASAQLRTLTEARAVALESIHKSELREARLQAQWEQLAARLQEEYEISSAQALALQDDPDVSDSAAGEVARLRRELRQMGEVNVSSIAEYEEVRTRSEFLTAQKADLDEARAKILEAIQEIDSSTRGVFMETFRAVAASFDKLFVRLFGGGKTELVLTTPDDLLETGIDILVQPPGKKRQPLALLSGGERALTAAALLFAFLDVKPSPFCVMDEVDAPLDGANVERFADLLRDFGQRSQFIIITHNPTTMEAAPIWYGITMQEPGISRVLSMKVPEIATAEPVAA